MTGYHTHIIGARPTNRVYRDSECTDHQGNITAAPVLVLNPDDDKTLKKFAVVLNGIAELRSDDDLDRAEIKAAIELMLLPEPEPEPVEVYTHRVVNKTGSVDEPVYYAACGKAWFPGKQKNIKIVGRCPECSVEEWRA